MYKRQEDAFERVAPRPALYFDCSMLQTPEVVNGKVQWRDLKCKGGSEKDGDQDDFLSLWCDQGSENIAVGDEVIWLVQNRPHAWATPRDMLGEFKGRSFSKFCHGEVIENRSDGEGQRLSINLAKECGSRQVVFRHEKGLSLIHI